MTTEVVVSVDWMSANRVWLEPYVRQLQEEMNLGHWKIDLESEWPEGIDQHSKACVWRATDYHKAYICCHEPSSDEDLRHSITHELVHLMLREVDEVLGSLESHFGNQAWEIIDERYRHSVEQSVDAIAEVIAARMPMPPSMAKRKRAFRDAE